MSRNMKDSGVEWIGEIPEEIQLISNKYLLSFVKGKNPENINAEKIGRPYIGASDLEKNGGFHNYENYCDEDLPLASKEDTLILWDGARAGLIGTGHEGYISSTIIKVVPRANYINKKFWYWYLKGFQPVMNEWVGGTTIPHMNRKYIHNIYFLKFPINHQQRMADFLDKKVTDIDHIITKTQASIEEYKRYKQSIITEAVTKGLDPNVPMKDSGIEWIGEIPEHWEIGKIGQIYKDRNIKVSDIDYMPLSVTKKGIVPQLESAAKTDNGDNRKLIKKNDFVINSRSDRRGSCGISNYDGSCSLINTVLEPKDYIHNGYYNYLFRSELFADEFYKWGSGIVEDLWSTKWSRMKRINIPVPSLHEQKTIDSYLNNNCSHIDHIISKKEQLINNLESYKKSLIYEVVTGKKEVI